MDNVKIKWYNGWFFKAVILSILTLIGFWARESMSNKQPEYKSPNLKEQKELIRYQDSVKRVSDSLKMFPSYP